MSAAKEPTNFGQDLRRAILVLEPNGHGPPLREAMAYQVPLAIFSRRASSAALGSMVMKLPGSTGPAGS